MWSLQQDPKLQKKNGSIELANAGKYSSVEKRSTELGLGSCDKYTVVWE